MDRNPLCLQLRASKWIPVHWRMFMAVMLILMMTMMMIMMQVSAAKSAAELFEDVERYPFLVAQTGNFSILSVSYIFLDTLRLPSFISSSSTVEEQLRFARNVNVTFYLPLPNSTTSVRSLFNITSATTTKNVLNVIIYKINATLSDFAQSFLPTLFASSAFQLPQPWICLLHTEKEPMRLVAETIASHGHFVSLLNLENSPRTLASLSVLELPLTPIVLSTFSGSILSDLASIIGTNSEVAESVTHLLDLKLASFSSPEWDWTKDLLLAINEIMTETVAVSSPLYQLLSGSIHLLAKGDPCNSMFVVRNSTLFASAYPRPASLDFVTFTCVAPTFSPIALQVMSMSAPPSTLLLVGSSNDCTDSSNDVAVPLYAAYRESSAASGQLSTSCSTFVDVTGAGRCQWSDEALFLDNVGSVGKCLGDENACFRPQATGISANSMLTGAQQRIALVKLLLSFYTAFQTTSFFHEGSSFQTFIDQLYHAANLSPSYVNSLTEINLEELAINYQFNLTSINWPLEATNVLPPIEYFQNCAHNGQLYNG